MLHNAATCTIYQTLTSYIFMEEIPAEQQMGMHLRYCPLAEKPAWLKQKCWFAKMDFAG